MDVEYRYQGQERKQGLMSINAVYQSTDSEGHCLSHRHGGAVEREGNIWNSYRGLEIGKLINCGGLG